jgi:hypothetical protein
MSNNKAQAAVLFDRWDRLKKKPLACRNRQCVPANGICCENCGRVVFPSHGFTPSEAKNSDGKTL